jgi:hypothetical protein
VWRDEVIGRRTVTKAGFARHQLVDKPSRDGA